MLQDPEVFDAKGDDSPVIVDKFCTGGGILRIQPNIHMESIFFIAVIYGNPYSIPICAAGGNISATECF
jgi:hypothetical protein